MIKLQIRTKRVKLDLTLGNEQIAEEGGLPSADKGNNSEKPIEVPSDVTPNVTPEEFDEANDLYEELINKLNEKTHITDIAHQYEQELNSNPSDVGGKITSVTNFEFPPPPMTRAYNKPSTHLNNDNLYDLTGDKDHLSKEFSDENLYPSVEIIDDSFERQLEKVGIAQNQRYLTYASSKGAMYEEYTE